MEPTPGSVSIIDRLVTNSSRLALGTIALASLFLYSFPRLGMSFLGLALILILINLVQANQTIRFYQIQVPLLLFLLTAFVGVWIAYDHQKSLTKFWFLLAAVLLFYALAGQRQRDLPRISRYLAYGVGLLSIFFLFSHDWITFPAGIKSIDQIGERWMTLRPNFGVSTIHPNKMAGMMVLFGPFLVESGVRSFRNGKRNQVLRITVAAILFLIGLLATGSRGAMLALFCGLGVWGLWLICYRVGIRIKKSPIPIFIILLLFFTAAIVTLLVAFPGGPLAVATQIPGAATAESRLVLYKQSLALSGDFLLSGAGLASFPGLYARYILFISVPFFFYTHNLFLDVLIEQGIFGLSALVAVYFFSGVRLVASARHLPKRKISQLSWLRHAVFASLIVIIIHGLVDDALYGELGTPLLFVAPGFALAVSATRQKVRKSKGKRGLHFSSYIAVGLVAFIVTISATIPALRGKWQANLGSIKMAQIELTSGLNTLLPGQIEESALQSAKVSFEQALSRDEKNRTAYHRLGLIAYSRGDFSTAIDQLTAAYSLDSDHVGIQKVLGFSYVWSGQYENALPLLEPLPESEHQLSMYSNWWQRVGRDDLTERADEMIARLGGIRANQ